MVPTSQAASAGRSVTEIARNLRSSMCSDEARFLGGRATVTKAERLDRSPGCPGPGDLHPCGELSRCVSRWQSKWTRAPTLAMVRVAPARNDYAAHHAPGSNPLGFSPARRAPALGARPSATSGAVPGRPRRPGLVCRWDAAGADVTRRCCSLSAAPSRAVDSTENAASGADRDRPPTLRGPPRRRK
jgi:hypothetical protein